MTGLTLDAGALIALGKRSAPGSRILRRALELGIEVAVPAGVVGQVWRGTAREAAISILLAADNVDVEPLDDWRARAAGRLCGITRTRDVIDASVVLCAKARGHTILTSDVDEIRALDPDVEIVR